MHPTHYKLDKRTGLTPDNITSMLGYKHMTLAGSDYNLIHLEEVANKVTSHNETLADRFNGTRKYVGRIILQYRSN